MGLFNVKMFVYIFISSPYFLIAFFFCNSWTFAYQKIAIFRLGKTLFLITPFEVLTFLWVSFAFQLVESFNFDKIFNKILLSTSTSILLFLIFFIGQQYFLNKRIIWMKEFSQVIQLQ